MGETLHIDGTYSKVVNFAMQQNYVPVIRKLTLKNPGETALEDLTVSVEVTPAFAAAWQEKIAQIPAGETVDLGAVPLLLLPEYPILFLLCLFLHQILQIIVLAFSHLTLSNFICCKCYC